MSLDQSKDFPRGGPDKEFELQAIERAMGDTSTPKDNNPASVDSRGRLPAEQRFDKWVYGGISYFAQAATGVVLTNWLKHGGGSKHFERIAKWLGPNFMTMVSKKKGAEAVEEASGTIIVTTMIMVGNAFLLPVKWLENRKPQFVRNMTESDNKQRIAHGETIPAEELAAQQKHLAILEAKPKQSWWSLIGGRAFGLGAVYGVLWGIGDRNNKVMEEGLLKVVQGGLKVAGAPKIANAKPLENYTRIAFYDMFYSTVSAGGLYVYSHLLHPLFFKNKKVDDDAFPPLEEAVLEVIDPQTYDGHGKPAKGRGFAAQPRAPQSLANVESATPSQLPLSIGAIA